MNGFFEELQRRKVYRVAVAYVIAAGGIIQLASAAFPAWELPNWALRLVIVFLLIGFPIALILAWAFDVTPAGIKATPSPLAASAVRRRNVIMLTITGILVSATAGFFLLPHAVARKIDKSIAVLPFESLSDDKENGYFADGVQDDILTNLSKIGDLKVISRTSVMSYRGQTRNVRDIGKALGVATILEGSVRRSGNKVRVNVQLIDATNDQHLWAEDYDGDLTDVFKIQTDLAHRIAEALQAKLSPGEKDRLERKPTLNDEAYLAFQSAHNFQSAYADLDRLKEGEQMYERAIQLDPNFALALARYSQLESWIVHTFERTPARRDKARSLAQKAVQLQPELPEAHLALGFALYYIESDFDGAAREFEIAQHGLPNEAEVYLALGAIQRRQGKWLESNASLEKAVSLNPKDAWAMQNLAVNYEVQRNFEAANRTIDRALAADPKAVLLLGMKAKLAVEERGDLETAEKILTQIDAIPHSLEAHAQLTDGRFSLLFFRRKFEEAAHEVESLADSTISGIPGALCSKYTGIGVAKKAAHDEAGARQFFDRAKTEAEREIKQDPDDAAAHARLAEALTWLGGKEAALREIRHARELLPESKDAYGGAEIAATEAEIYAVLGDASASVPLLDELLQRPSSITVAVLKINPIWDPIRADPRFKALLEKFSGKAESAKI